MAGFAVHTIGDGKCANSGRTPMARRMGQIVHDGCRPDTSRGLEASLGRLARSLSKVCEYEGKSWRVAEPRPPDEIAKWTSPVSVQRCRVEADERDQYQLTQITGRNAERTRSVADIGVVANQRRGDSLDVQMRN